MGIKDNKMSGFHKQTEKKNWVHVHWKIKNMKKKNCNVGYVKNELMILTKKITDINVISRQWNYFYIDGVW